MAETPTPNEETSTEERLDVFAEEIRGQMRKFLEGIPAEEARDAIDLATERATRAIGRCTPEAISVQKKKRKRRERREERKRIAKEKREKKKERERAAEERRKKRREGEKRKREKRKSDEIKKKAEDFKRMNEAQIRAIANLETVELEGHIEALQREDISVEELRSIVERYLKVTGMKIFEFSNAVGIIQGLGSKFLNHGATIKTKTLIRLWALQQVEAALRKKEEK